MAVPAVGRGVSSVVHRLCQRQDPRRERGQPADLRGAGGHRHRHPGHLGLWAGEHGDGEGAKTGCGCCPRSRTAASPTWVVCDGLKGLLEAIATVGRPRSPKRVWSTCCGTRFITRPSGTGRRSPAISNRSTPRRRSRPPWTFFDFTEHGAALPAIIKLWENAWPEFVPFLRFDTEIRTVVCTTNAIESINARIRRAVNARGHFPTEQAALKCVYLAIMSLDPKGTGQKRWSNRWKSALNAFEITFDGRSPSDGNNTNKISYTKTLTVPAVATARNPIGEWDTGSPWRLTGT